LLGLWLAFHVGSAKSTMPFGPATLNGQA